MKIFYSWQSDTPNRVGRAFIREALDVAVSGLDVSESERPEVDQDTAGILGSPVIANTIFDKIREAAVVVADVTLTGQTRDGKRLANSNVCIELGYAIGTRGDGVLLKVMNTYYGAPGGLPFDLAHRRWPVQFQLAPDASREDRSNCRAALAKEFRKILQSYIEAHAPPKETFTPATATSHNGAYWRPNENLLEHSSWRLGELSATYGSDVPLVYLRIWPDMMIAPLTVRQLNDFNVSTIEPLGGRTGGWSYSHNRYGVLTFTHDRDEGLAATTQVFESGEIWGLNAWWLRDREDMPEGTPHFVPSQAYEEGVRHSLDVYMQRAIEHFGYPSTIHIESGLINADGYRLAMAEMWDRYSGRIYDNIVTRVTVDADDRKTITLALLQIYENMYAGARVVRPDNYYGFPEK